MPETREELIKEYQRLLDIQLSNGNWDADPYMHGMANGMIMFHQMAANPGHTPEFKTAPQYWKRQLPRALKAMKRGYKKLWRIIKWGMARFISTTSGLRFDFPKQGKTSNGS